MEHRFFSYLYAIRARLARKRMKRNRKEGAHIAMFHDIKPAGTKMETVFDCFISDLEDYLKYCKQLGLRFVSLDEILSGNVEQKVALTFDDGFESVFTLVLPLLKKMKIPFTVYVTTGYIDKPGYLSIEQLQLLAKEPLCTIGMHAHEHEMFRYKSAFFLQADFVKCKDILTELTGTTPTHYAFPYGSVYAVSGNNVRTVKRLGVNSIVLTEQKMLTQRDVNVPYRLPRLDIPGYYNGRIPLKYRGIGVGKV